MFRRLSVKQRMYVIMAMTLFMFIVNAQFAWMNLNKVKDLGVDTTTQVLLESEKEKIKAVTSSMALSLATVLESAGSAEQKEDVLRTFIDPARFEDDKSGYFFIYRGTTVIANPAQPELIGKDLGSTVDENGVQVVSELFKQARDGGGFVEYVWPKPGSESSPKISYAQMIAGSDYWVGTGIYADTNEQYLEQLATDLTKIVEKRSYYMIATVGLIYVLISLLSLYIIFGIVKALKSMIHSFQDVAEGEGDLTKRIELDSQDELAELSSWFNLFLEKLQSIIKQLSQSASSVDESSSELLVIAHSMSERSSFTSTQADKVSASTVEMSSNLTTAANVMEESTNSSNMVATASEQMSATINEIAENSERARAISGDAVQQASQATGQMSELGEAAEKIGMITETITEISEQTNLLALNATIEAARAGDAGKGFAVVANEIKELAKQTAEATQNIKHSIGGVQDTSEKTISAIDQISTVIEQVNDIVAGIATAVEEQSAATAEIASNIAKTTGNINKVNENVNQCSTVATEITAEIEEVNEAATELSGNSDQIKNSAEQLNSMAHALTEIVQRFKV
ncbi:MAG: methyl-accepting chemotaxis protein [Desulfobulbaceae bacterium]|nr:MAG: methyl-accepting chemotaxis protein [Desulfobulbaceae bacterium]